MNEETDLRIAMVVAFVVLHEAQVNGGLEGQTAKRLRRDSDRLSRQEQTLEIGDKVRVWAGGQGSVGGRLP